MNKRLIKSNGGKRKCRKPSPKDLDVLTARMAETDDHSEVGYKRNGTQPTTPARTRQEYAMLIREEWREVNAGWRQSVKGILNTATVVKESNEELDPAEFDAMLNDDDLGFSASTGRKLIRIEANKTLCAHVHNLPPHWGTLYELSKVNRERLLAAIEDGTVNPDMSRREAMALQSGSGGGISAAHPQTSEGCPCAFHRGTAQVPHGHQWSEDDDVEDQDDIADLADKVGDDLERAFNQCRAKVLQLTDDRLHPDIRRTLADRLRDHIELMTGWVNDLSPSAEDQGPQS